MRALYFVAGRSTLPARRWRSYGHGYASQVRRAGCRRPGRCAFISTRVTRALAADSRQKLGFALCGLGSLSTNQIAPALQKTAHCRLAGIITGTPAKAVEWQAQYNIPQRNVYNYENMHRIADNPDIDVVYVVTPNALHLTTRW